MTRNEIIHSLFTGRNFNDCINKMEPAHLRDDLRQEVIMIICEQPEEKIVQLHNDKALEFFTVRVILNQIKSKTSPFAKKYRSIVLSYMDDVSDLHRHKDKAGFLQDNSDIENEERELRELIEDMAVEEIDKLHWYNKGLIELYVKYGNFRAIQKETGIPFGSCYKTIKKSFEQIRQKIKP